MLAPTDTDIHPQTHTHTHHSQHLYPSHTIYLLYFLQLLLSQSIIPIVHKLEQVSSDEHVGTLAENLMEAIKEHHLVALRVRKIMELVNLCQKF